MMSVIKKYPKHTAEGPTQKQDQKPNGEQEDEHEVEEEEPELTDTIFIRNLARFDTTQESLKEYIEKNFGETVYCLICKDRETGESKGTGFVKFKSVETAEKCLEEYEDPDHQTKFFLDGRNLFVLPALSRSKIDEVKRATAPSTSNNECAKKKKKKPRHNRAKPPPSQVANIVAKSEHPAVKSSFQNKKTHNSSVDKHRAPLKKDASKPGKGNRQASKAIKKGEKGKKVKNDMKNKKKVIAKQNTKNKPRGRH